MDVIFVMLRNNQINWEVYHADDTIQWCSQDVIVYVTVDE